VRRPRPPERAVPGSASSFARWYRCARWRYSFAYLAFVRPRHALNGEVGDNIPGVADPIEQEQRHRGADEKQRRLRVDGQQRRRRDQREVGEERTDPIPDPIFQHRCVAFHAALALDDGGGVQRPRETADTEREGGGMSVCHGALSRAARRSATPKDTTVGVVYAAIPPVLTGSRVCTMSVITTKIKPVSTAAAEPTMT
jgi:hypothetical protein